MPCPHNEITIVQRSQRQSAVAAAAYQSGEKLFCEYAICPLLIQSAHSNSTFEAGGFRSRPLLSYKFVS